MVIVMAPGFANAYLNVDISVLIFELIENHFKDVATVGQF